MARDTSPLDHDVKPPEFINDAKDFHGSFAANTVRITNLPETPWYKRPTYFTNGWNDPYIWAASLMEGVGTFCLTWLSGSLGVTLANYDITVVGPFASVWFGALLAILIYATATKSGGHLNPLFTLPLMVAGFTPVPRGVLYIIFQTAGAAVGGCFLLASLGYEKTRKYKGGSCYYDPLQMTSVQVLLNEICSGFILIFVALAILDPRQAQAFGPRTGPLVVGIAAGLILYATSGVASGYGGVNMNPARCLGIAIASGDWSTQWIWWVSTIIAGSAYAALYNILPPERVIKPS